MFCVALTLATEYSVLVFSLKFKLHQQDHKTLISETCSGFYDPSLCVLQMQAQLKTVPIDSITTVARGAKKAVCLHSSAPNIITFSESCILTSNPSPGSCLSLWRRKVLLQVELACSMLHVERLTFSPRYQLSSRSLNTLEFEFCIYLWIIATTVVSVIFHYWIHLISLLFYCFLVH